MSTPLPPEARPEALSPRRRGLRAVGTVVMGALLVAGLFVFGGGWYYASEVLDVPLVDPADETYIFEDPGAAGLSYENVSIPGPLGEYPAWLVEPPTASGTWVIGVHGRGASRAEGIRLATITVPAGYPTLLISTRNDGDAPATEEMEGFFGDREWRDLEAAVDYAVVSGAEDVILAGFSQGGSLVAFYMRRGDTSVVRGMLLDSPLLGLHRTLVVAAQDRDVPDPLIPPLLWGTKVMLSLQAGFDSAAPEHLDHVDDWLTVPTLLIHGSADETVPVGGSDELAERAPAGLLTYLRLDGVGHVRGYNVARDAYVEAVRNFLGRVGAA